MSSECQINATSLKQADRNKTCVPNGGICLLKHTYMFKSAAYGDLQVVQTNKFSGHCSG